MDTIFDINRIRHYFGDVRPVSLSTIINQFIEFAKYNGFLTEEISKMNTFPNVSESRKNVLLEPDKN